MAEDRPDAQAIARRLTSALQARDLESLGEILAPDVRWGGEEDTPQTCHNRADVLAWYGGLHARGFRASVVGGGRAGPCRAHPRCEPAGRRDE